MAEGEVHRADKAEFRECLHLSWNRPYILRLAVSAGIGGLLFGYDTGVISGALLYIRDDFASVDRSTMLQETIVSMAVAGAIVGAAIGGWMNDQYGRKFSILVADTLFLIGAVVMAVSPMPGLLITGRILVGLGVGMASMNAPLYISEASPATIRGALVSTNGLLITGGQFLAYCINLAFTKAPGTWRWMLGVAGVPAAVQLVLMLFLPESPRWLYRKNRKVEAEEILSRIYPPNEVGQELEVLRQSIEAEIAEEGSLDGGEGLRSVFARAKSAWCNTIVRRGLVAGIICQVAQQFVGINTIMYYSPNIVQLAGFASNSTAMALSLITSGLNAIGSVISMAFVDKFGRRRLLLISMVGIILCLFGLFAVFEVAAKNAPPVSKIETSGFGNNTCSSFIASQSSVKWSCVECLAATPECGFCANAENKLHPGACLNANQTARSACGGKRRTWYSRGCPSNVGLLAVLVLGLYIISYSPGMGTVPWIVNSEIYPLRYRGICGGMAAVANWTSNLIVSQLFLTLTDHLGPAYTFFLFGCVSCIAFVSIFFFVPETKGLPFEEVEKMLGERTWKAWK